ncbi:hypothetical protein C8R44DRAFT_751425 [Mycena epipterygia]|nr:hypothetical protein C8R44DRAFT_751425 [Mycena epipterygia]
MPLCVACSLRLSCRGALLTSCRGALPTSCQELTGSVVHPKPPARRQQYFKRRMIGAAINALGFFTILGGGPGPGACNPGQTPNPSPTGFALVTPLGPNKNAGFFLALRDVLDIRLNYNLLGHDHLVVDGVGAGTRLLFSLYRVEVSVDLNLQQHNIPGIGIPGKASHSVLLHFANIRPVGTLAHLTNGTDHCSLGVRVALEDQAAFWAFDFPMSQVKPMRFETINRLKWLNPLVKRLATVEKEQLVVPWVQLNPDI